MARKSKLFCVKHNKNKRIRKNGNLICPDCAEERTKAWRLRNPGKQRNLKKNSNLLRNYGITLEDYLNLVEKQKGICAICGNIPQGRNPRGGSAILHVDHDPMTGIIRGLLCPECNLALGLFKHDNDILLNAVDYLQNKRSK